VLLYTYTLRQVKKLIVLNPQDARTVSSLTLRVPEVVGTGHSLLHLLNTFQLGRTHLAIVSQSPKVRQLSLHAYYNA
jgi:CBS domain containing-hemolysin-like protein